MGLLVAHERVYNSAGLLPLGVKKSTYSQVKISLAPLIKFILNL